MNDIIPRLEVIAIVLHHVGLHLQEKDEHVKFGGLIVAQFISPALRAGSTLCAFAASCG